MPVGGLLHRFLLKSLHERAETKLYHVNERQRGPMELHRPIRAYVTRIPAVAARAALVITALSLFAPAALLASASAWTVDTSTRTEAEMRAKWEQLKPVYTGAPYAVTPSWADPYAPGDAAAGFRADGVNMMNFGRYLAGLPADLTLSPEYNNSSQYGAVLLRRLGYLTHKPDESVKPADMPLAFFDEAKASTSTSNIGSGYASSAAFQRGCLDDASANNIGTVGHRRWILNPPITLTGIGYADGYHTTKVTGTSAQRSDVAYSHIDWPSAGIFPVEFVTARTPWSITLDKDEYDWDASGFTVTMRRVSDGRTWTFDATDTNTAGEYFTANFGGFGAGNAFIFRPDPASISYKAGDQFDITLRGNIFAQGTRTPVTVSYRTSFGALSGAATTFASDPRENMPAPSPVADPSAMPVYRFYNLRNGSHFYTASATERDQVIVKLAGTYKYEGAAYTVDTTSPSNSAPLYRFYNKGNSSHFYTASESEKNDVIARLSGTYVFEGAAYNVCPTGEGSPLYRFYNKRNNSHFYTISPTERDQVIATLGATYVYEGTAFYLVQ